MWTKTEDGSVIDAAGKVMFFSTERFISDIVLGEYCFICGASPNQKLFNDEHILPEWLLRHYDLFSRSITLPNGASVRYDKYTVPCCADCNSLMGDTIETVISGVVKGGLDSINEFVSNGGGLKLFVWLGLIFLKTHLKDRSLRFNLDTRQGNTKIADDYDWNDLHHVHCLVRCFYNNCFVEPEAFGSFLIIPTKSEISLDLFDYSDLYFAQTILLKLGDVALVAVLNDTGGAMSYFFRKFEKITGPVSELQLREIMVEMAFLNLHMEERPLFYSEFDLSKQELRMVADLPVLQLADLDYEIRGKMLHNEVQYALGAIKSPGLDRDAISKEILAGRFTFLFDKNGNFQM